MPDQPTDQFKNAETSVDKQRMDALNALASYGRRGLEAAVARKQDVESGRAQAVQSATIPGIVARDQGEIDNIAASPYQSYALDAAKAASNLSQENNALQEVQGNYFNQVREAVPLYRTNAQSVTDQYRKNYEERQAGVARQQAALEAQREQAMIAIESQRQAMAQDAAIHAAQMAAYGAAGGGGGSAGGQYGGDPLLADKQMQAAQLVAAATAEAIRKAQAQTAAKGIKSKAGRRF